MNTFNKIIMAIALMASFVSCSNGQAPKVKETVEDGQKAIKATFDDGMEMTFQVSNDATGEVKVQNCRPTSEHVIIPSQITSKGVAYKTTSIGRGAFEDCTSLTSITIPNSVTSIGEYAFHNCTSLTSIIIPNSVTSIYWSVFSGCSRLTKIVVAEENKNYDSRDNCNAIIETASNKLIVGCSNTKIPNSVISIGTGAFAGGCESLVSIAIPNSVTSIGAGAFSDCKSLTSITIPNSVTSIGEYAFSSTALTSITIPNSVTSIGNGAFWLCNNLTFVNIQNTKLSSSLDYNSVFKDCKKLKPSNVKYGF